VLDVIPDDVDTLAQQAGYCTKRKATLRGLLRFLAPLNPPRRRHGAWKYKFYQRFLKRRPAEMISRLSEILANPDPALGYNNGELRFWLGWAKDVAGDHAAARKVAGQGAHRTRTISQRTAG